METIRKLLRAVGLDPGIVPEMYDRKFKRCDGCGHNCVNAESNPECPCDTDFSTGRTNCAKCPIKKCNSK